MKRLYALAVLFLPLIALAHPGHDHFAGHSPAHYFSSPLHLTSLAAVILLVVVGIAAWKRIQATPEDA